MTYDHPEDSGKFAHSYTCGCSIVWTKEFGVQLTSVCDRHDAMGRKRDD